MAQDTKTTPQAVDAAANEIKEELEGSLETIKEIIVGQYSRDVQKKLTQLDARLSRDLSEIQNQTTKRDEALESFARRELEVLREEIQQEQKDRSRMMERISTELASTIHSLEERIGQISQTAGDSLREVRTQMMRQYQDLSQDLAKRQKSLSDELEKAVAGLEARKPDRQLIATMMLRMAAALQPDTSQGETKVTALPPRTGKKSA